MSRNFIFIGWFVQRNWFRDIWTCQKFKISESRFLLGALHRKSEGAVSIRPGFWQRPIFFLILLNEPLYIGFVYANYLVEWSNHLEDIFKLNGWDDSPPPPQHPTPPHPTNLTGDKCIYSFTAWHFILNENILVWLTISFQK